MARQRLFNKWSSAREVQLSTALDLNLSDTTVYRLGRLVITSVRLHDVGLVGGKEPVSAVSEAPSDTEVSSISTELVSLGLPTTFGKKGGGPQYRRGEGRRTPAASANSSRFAGRGERQSRSHSGEGVHDGSAAAAASGNRDTPWVQGFDEQWRCHYYYNTLTQESIWEAPAEGYVPWEQAAAGPPSAPDETRPQHPAAEPQAAGARPRQQQQQHQQASDGVGTAAGAGGLARMDVGHVGPGGSAAGAATPGAGRGAEPVAPPPRPTPRMLTEEDLLRAMGLWQDSGGGEAGGGGGTSTQPAAAAAAAPPATLVPPASGGAAAQSGGGEAGGDGLSSGGLLRNLLLRSPAPQPQPLTPTQLQQRAVPPTALSEEQLLARLSLGTSSQSPMPPPPPAPAPPPPGPPPPLAATASSSPAPAEGAAGPKPAARRMLTEDDVLRSMGLLPANPAGVELRGAGSRGNEPPPPPAAAAAAEVPAVQPPTATLTPPPGFGMARCPPAAQAPGASLVGQQRPGASHQAAPSALPPPPPRQPQQQPAPHAGGPAEPSPLHPPYHHHHHHQPGAYHPLPPHGFGAAPRPAPPPGFLLPPGPASLYADHAIPHYPHGPFHGGPEHPPPPPGFGTPPPPYPQHPPMDMWPPPGAPFGPPQPPNAMLPPPPPGFGPGHGLPYGPPSYPYGHVHSYPPYGMPPYGMPPGFPHAGGPLALPPPLQFFAPDGYPLDPSALTGPMGPEGRPPHPHQTHHAHAQHQLYGGSGGGGSPRQQQHQHRAHEHYPPRGATNVAGGHAGGGGGVSQEPNRRAVTWTLEELERQLEVMAEVTGEDGVGMHGAEALSSGVAGVAARQDAGERAGVRGRDGSSFPPCVLDARCRQRQQAKEDVGQSQQQLREGRYDPDAAAAAGGGRDAGGSRSGVGAGKGKADADAGDDDDDAAFYDTFAGGRRGGAAAAAAAVAAAVGAAAQHQQRLAPAAKPPGGGDDGTRRVMLDPYTAAYVRNLLPRSAAKYWMQRYSLFSRFDSLVQLDTEGWWSVTPEVLAAHQAVRSREMCDGGMVAMDACCGCGGNVIQMAGTFPVVIGVEISPKRVEMARHNAEVYGVGNKCQFLCADFFQVAQGLKVDLLFMSPPWGGPKYQHVHTFDVFFPLVGFNKSLMALLDVTLDCVRGQNGVVAAFLPRNTDLVQLAAVVPEHAVWEVERAYVNNKLKGITLYCHPGRLPDQPNVRLQAEVEHMAARPEHAAAG